MFAIDIFALLLVAPALFSQSVPELMVTLASALVPVRVSVFDPILTNDPAPEMDPEYVELEVWFNVSDWPASITIFPPVDPPPEMFPIVSELAI